MSLACMAATLSLLLAPMEAVLLFAPSAAPEERSSEDSSTDECKGALLGQAAARRSRHRTAAGFAMRWQRDSQHVVLVKNRVHFDGKASLRAFAGAPLRI